MTCRELIAKLTDELDPKSGPLIITVFGDAIVPRSNDIWLGSLIAILAQLGLSERLVRTGVYRLARDGWLESRSRGRRSYYALTPKGQATFAEADARIYASRAPAWNGHWTLVNMLADIGPAERRNLRETLKWRGFGQLSPTVMVKPQRETHSTASSAISGLSLGEHVSVFSGTLEDANATASLQQTAKAAWNLGDINASYVEFVGHFQAFLDKSPTDPANCFALRTLLIHEYRRTLLKDPQLPSELLAPDWSGQAARDLTASLYLQLASVAEKFIAENFENWDGSAASNQDCLSARFA